MPTLHYNSPELASQSRSVWNYNYLLRASKIQNFPRGHAPDPPSQQTKVYFTDFHYPSWLLHLLACCSTYASFTMTSLQSKGFKNQNLLQGVRGSHDFGIIQIHTLPIATEFNFWQINFFKFLQKWSGAVERNGVGGASLKLTKYRMVFFGKRLKYSNRTLNLLHSVQK